MARPRKNAAKAQGSLLTPDEVVEIPVEEQPYLLPEGWRWVRLGKLYQINPRIIADDNTMASFVPMEKIEPGMKGTFTFESLPWGKAKKGHTQFADGDVAFAKISPCFENGKSMLVRGLKNGIGAGTTELIILRQPSVLQKYTFYLICSSDFIQKGTHTYSGTVGQQRISMDFVRNYPVPLPPLNDQQRIVDSIESLFAKLDEAREKAKAVLNGFESRKAAILHKAFTGELTAKWREEHGVGMESWEKKKIKEIAMIGSGGTPDRSEPLYYQGDIPWVKTGEIKWNHIKYSEEHISESALTNSSAKIYPIGTVLVAMYGQGLTRGRAAILAIEASTNQAVCALIASQHIDNHMLFYYFMYNYWNFRKHAFGGVQPNYSASMIGSLSIDLPTYPEQKEIVRCITSLLEKGQQVRDAAESVLERIDLMKKSILAKAFRGELTGQVHN